MPFHHESRAHPEPVTPGQGWEVRHRLHGRDSEGNELYIPTRVGSEIRAKASGALLALTALIVTWILNIVFATRFGHVGLVGFKVILAIQFLLWTILRQGMSIVALVAFDMYYTAAPRGRRRTLSLYGLDAWMSLIVTPINIFRGKFLHVLLVLLPSILSILAAYATSGLLGRETAFQLHERGTQKIHISAAGGGSAHNYIMTGQEFVYNSSQGCLALPENRFVFFLEDDKVLIPSIPDIGTFNSESRIRAAKFQSVPSVLATLSARVESNRSVVPSKNGTETTVPTLGDISLSFIPIDFSSSIVQVQLLLLSRGIHRQIYLDIHYRTSEADLLFATFNNGSHINRVYDVRNVSEEIPGRLKGTERLAMDSVLDNFILSQNGGTLLKVTRHDDTRVQHLGLLLAASFGIRSARLQNWIDGAGEREAVVYEEREVVKIPARYWAVAATISGLLALACILLCVRRPTVNGNLVQIVALLQRFIQKCNGACTPNWQKAYAEDKAFEDRNMNQRVALGYAADKDGGREIFLKADSRGFQRQSYGMAFDAPEKVTKDKPSNLYGLLAG